MNLHIVNDEKIINRTIDVFDECLQGQNVYVVMKTKRPFRWVTERDNVLTPSELLERSGEYSFDKVFIHLLNRKKINLIEKLDLHEAKIYWIIWGLDLYNNLLEPKGFEMIDPDSEYAKSRRLKDALTGWFSRMLDSRKERFIADFIRRRIDYIVTDTTDNDYDYLLRYYPEFKDKQWKDFFYYPIDVILGDELYASQVEGRNLIIGNSASRSNNHEFAIRKLEGLNLEERKVYVPLSYSIVKPYVKTVEKVGDTVLGQSYCPLHSFMPLEEYNRLQQSVSVAIYGNWRQEAIGNILISLYLGAKVYLAKRNPVYEWAQRHDLIVFPLEEISQEGIDTTLSEADKEHNKSILQKLYCKERMFQLIREL